MEQEQPAGIGPVERGVGRLAPERAEIAECRACCGKGWNDEYHAVAGHYNGGETFRIECEACEGVGKC